MEYWRIQDPKKPLFENLLWSKPEQKSLAGRVGLVGGSKGVFLAVAKAHQAITELGPETSLVLPADLKPLLKTIPNVVFSTTNPSGGLASQALSDLLTLQNSTDSLLLIGDAGKNSETNLLYENLALKISDQTKPVIVARDAIELISGAFHHVVNQPNFTLIMSFAQAQKLFRSVYYPVMLLHSMTTLRFVEALHKFTITYQPTLVIFHQNQVFIARDGQVISGQFERASEIWQGIIQAKIACWQTWNPQKPLEATTCAILS